MLTGFPWLFIGYSLTDSPFAGLLPVVGALGTSFLALLGTVGATLCLRAAWRSLPMPKAALVIPRANRFGVSALAWVTPLGQYSAAIVQGNVDQAIKWDADQRSVIVNRYLSLSEPHWSTDTLVWPEFALTAYGAEAERVTVALHTSSASDTNVVIGAPRVEWSAAARKMSLVIACLMLPSVWVWPMAWSPNTTWCLLVITCRYKTGCVG